MYAELLSKAQPIPPAAGATPQGAVTLLNREALPQIGFWNQRDWTSYKSKQQNDGALTGDHGARTFDFIESEEGIPVSADRIKSISRDSRELFQSLKVLWEKSGRSVPETWGKMTFGNKEFYRQKMKELYPELSFCEGDWKCEHLATQLYPGWYRNHVKSKVEAGPESNRRLRKTKSPTPIPTGGISGSSHSPSVPTPMLNNVPGLSTVSPTSPPAFSSTPSPGAAEQDHPPQTPIQLTPTATLAVTIGTSLDTGVTHEIDMLSEESPGASPVLGATHPPSVPSPSFHLNDGTRMVSSVSHATAIPNCPPPTPITTCLVPDKSASPGTTLPLGTPVQTVVAPGTSTPSPQPETTPNSSIQVRRGP